MNTDQVGGIIRSVLIAGGMYFVNKGMTDQNTMMTIVSGLMTLGGAGWSIYSNRSSKLANPKPVIK